MLLYSAYKKYDNHHRKGRWDFLHFFLGSNLYFKLKNYLEVRPVAHLYLKGKNATDLKTIVLMFDGQVYNAGLADRLRSMASVFSWCKKHGLELKIFFNQPFALSDYLVPNLYDWIVSKDFLDYSIACPKALISFSKIFGEDNNRLFHREALDYFLKCGKEQIHLYTNTYCYDECFYECFNELFKPSAQLETELNGFGCDIGTEYISVSFRFTQLLGDLKDTFGQPLPEKEREVLIKKCIDSIMPILDDNKVEKCLVTSDSKTFLEEVSKLPYVYLLPGEVGHISNDVSEEQIRKTFWDMFMISRAKKAYMVRTKQMYRSGFAMRAAMIGDIPFEELIID